MYAAQGFKMGRKLGDWGREASQGPREDAGDWEEDRELQEAVQRSLRDLAATSKAAAYADTWQLECPVTKHPVPCCRSIAC